MRVLLALMILGNAAVSRADAAVSDARRSDPFWGIVAARTRGGPLAAWTEGHVYVSRDGGRAFVEHALEDHIDVAADGDEVYWLGASELIVDTPRGVERRELPALGQKFRVVAGDGVVAVIALHEVVYSRDGGRHWRALEVPGHGNAGEELSLGDGGQLQWMVGSEAACGGGFQTRWSGTLGAAGASWREAAWPLDAPGSWKLAPGGWAYAVGRCDGEREGLCAVHDDARLLPIAPDNDDFALAHDGRNVFVAAGGRLYRVRGAHATALGDAPPKIGGLAVDAAGRVFAVAGAALYQRAAGSWRRLRPR